MLFDSDFLKKLEYLSLVSRRVFRGQLLAQRRTKQLGGGIEFGEHREYAPGDDLRYLDWNIYARYGDVLLKRFQQDEDLHVYFLIDASHSMIGTGGAAVPKFDYARRVATALAYVALADLERVSMLAYADKVLDVMPLTRGKQHILSIMRFMEGLETSGNCTRLKSVARSLVTRAQRPGLVVILSDFFDQDGFREGVDLLRYRRFEPHLVQLHTPEEANPTLLGDIELEEAETGAKLNVTITERKLREYRELFVEFLQSMDKYCRTSSLSCTRTTTDLPFDELILRMMRTAGVTT